LLLALACCWSSTYPLTKIGLGSIPPITFISARSLIAAGFLLVILRARRIRIPTDAKAVATQVWDQMKTCYDPEIPVNIVELGLVYENKVEPLPEGGFKVDVKFTLTAPGCGMGPILQSEVQSKVLAIPGVKSANIEVVFEPQWTQAMMSDAAKLQLGMM